MEDAGETQAHGEQQIGQQRNHNGRLQLEAPPDLGTGGAHADQGDAQGGERREHATRVGGPVPARLGARSAGLLDQRQHLDGQHRKDAGHQIENDAADESEKRSLQHRGKRYGFVRRACRVHGDVGELERLPRRRSPEGLLNDKHAASIRGRGRRQRAALQAQDQTVVGDLELLGRRVPHQGLRVGEEVCRANRRRRQSLGGDFERQGVRRKVHVRAPGRGLRQGPVRGVEKGRGGCVRRSWGTGACNGQAVRHARLARDTLRFAHQPGGVGRNGDRRSSIERVGRRNAGKQGNSALVAEVEEMRDGDALWRRPGNGTGREARWQPPIDRDGFPGVARIAPVDVPVVPDAQPQADPKGLTRFHRCGFGNELRSHQL
jgi:hypothetical protein